MSGFFGIIMSSLQPAISSKSLSVIANASTSSINVSSTAYKRVQDCWALSPQVKPKDLLFS